MTQGAAEKAREPNAALWVRMWLAEDCIPVWDGDDDNVMSILVPYLIEKFDEYAASERARADKAERLNSKIIEQINKLPSVTGCSPIKRIETETDNSRLRGELGEMRDALKEAKEFLAKLEPSLWLLATSGNKEAVGNFNTLKALLSRTEKSGVADGGGNDRSTDGL